MLCCFACVCCSFSTCYLLLVLYTYQCDYVFPLQHALILSVIIGGFWLLDTIKDPLFATIVGIEYQPTAKLLSVVFTIFTVMVYDHLSSDVSKPTLFYIVSGTYGILFLIISGCLPNHQGPGEEQTQQIYSKELGWISFFVIESYGSMMVAMFWSFTNSIMDLEEAKGAYGLILSIAQTGAILGSTLALNAKTIGYPSLFLIGSMTSLSVTLFIKLYHIVFVDEDTVAATSRVRTWTDDEESVRSLELRITGFGSAAAAAAAAATHSASTTYSTDDDDTESVDSHRSHSEEKGAVVRYFNSFTKWFAIKFGGFCEGLALIFQHKYVMRIFAVSCFYEIVITVLDYEFKMLGAGSLTPSHSAEDNSGDSFKFATLMGRFGQLTNLLTMVVSLFGFSFFVNTFGVRNSLMIFPSLLLSAVIIANLVPSLWVLFFTVSILKACAYSLNDPVKELLYQPTSVPIKYKAKAWIDVFGSRLAKAGGSSISHLAHGSVARLQLVSELPSFAISIIFLVLAWQAGTQFQYLVSNDLVVGECTAAEENNEGGGGGKGGGMSKGRRNRLSAAALNKLPERNGLRPGDVGYDGYDPEGVFEGVFEGHTGTGTGTGNGGTHAGRTHIAAGGQRQRHLNNDVFRSGAGEGAKKAIKKAPKIKIRSSAAAPTTAASPAHVSNNSANSGTPAPADATAGGDEEEGRERCESANF
jgi:ATP/ADP translocase